MATSPTQVPLLVQAIYSFKGKNNDEVRIFSYLKLLLRVFFLLISPNIFRFLKVIKNRKMNIFVFFKFPFYKDYKNDFTALLILKIRLNFILFKMSRLVKGQ